MIKLDDNLLKELGLDALPKEEKAAFLRHMYETLEMRVGTRLAERMSEQQMVEFEQFINTGDEQGAFKWLEANFPNYKEVVAEEFEKLKGEVIPVAAQIVATSQQHVQTAQAQTHQAVQSGQSAQPMQQPMPHSQPQVAPQQSSPYQPQPYGPAPGGYGQQSATAQPQQPYGPVPQPQAPSAQPQANPYQVTPPTPPQSDSQQYGLAA